VSKFGRYQIVEPQENMLLIHRHDGVTPLNTVDWEPLNGVLDQEDLLKQGIDTSVLIPGAPKVDALGSCTANATMSALSHVLDEAAYLAFATASAYGDVVGIEKAAIEFYHGCTYQTAEEDQEWPPTDCGSTGPYIVEYLQTLKLISGQKIAQTIQDLCSLLQSGPVLEGTPFFNAWMTPDANGFVDGNGSIADVEGAMRSGVAGGHETCISGIVAIGLTETNLVIPSKTIFKVRNSWTESWGDDGSFLIHGSALEAILQYADFRQLVA
jgi:hypothetical protein